MFGKVNVDALLDDISYGVSITRACGKQGIADETYHRWGRENAEFRLKRDTKIVSDQKSLLRKLRDPLTPWQGAAWILERIHKDHFIAQQPSYPGVNVNVATAVTVMLDPVKLEQERALLDSLQRLPDSEALNPYEGNPS